MDHTFRVLALRAELVDRLETGESWRSVKDETWNRFQGSKSIEEEDIFADLLDMLDGWCSPAVSLLPYKK